MPFISFSYLSVLANTFTVILKRDAEKYVFRKQRPVYLCECKGSLVSQSYTVRPWHSYSSVCVESGQSVADSKGMSPEMTFICL